jgi:hypothetical protein
MFHIEKSIPNCAGIEPIPHSDSRSAAVRGDEIKRGGVFETRPAAARRQPFLTTYKRMNTQF